MVKAKFNAQTVSTCMVELVMIIILGYPNTSSLRAPIIIAAFVWSLLRKGSVINLRVFSPLQLFWSFGVFLLVAGSSLWALDQTGVREVATNTLWCAMISFILFDYIVTYKTGVEDFVKLLYPVIAVLLLNVLINGTRDSNNRLSVAINENVFGLISFGMCHYFFYLMLERKNRKALYSIFFGTLLLLSLFSGSRKVLLSLVIYAIGYIQFRNKEKNAKKFLFRWIVFFIVLLAAYFAIMNIDALYETIGQRVETFLLFLSGEERADKSMYSRVTLIEAAFEAFKTHPVLGIGANNFKYYSHFISYSHNGYMEILCDFGLVGFVVYYVPILVFLGMAIKNWNRGAQDAIVPLCVIIAFFVNEAAAVSYFSYHKYLLISVVLGFTENLRRERKRARKSLPKMTV